MFDVITIGTATQDVFLQSEAFHLMYSPKLKRMCEYFPLGQKINIERIDFATGGGATNAAATFKNLGFRVGIIAKVGDDTAGREVLSDLRIRKVSMKFVVRSPHSSTGYSAILLTPHGDRTALVYRGVSSGFTSADIPWHAFRSRWLFVTSLAGDLKLLKRIFKTARAQGTQVAFNPGVGELRFGIDKVRAYCGAANVLIINRDEASLLAGGAQDIIKIRHALRAHFQSPVVVTDGERGAYYWDPHRFYFIPTRRVTVVNSTGAGDAFGSGFISGILRWQDPVRALQLATLNALGTIRLMGAKKGLLTRWPTDKALHSLRIKKM